MLFNSSSETAGAGGCVHRPLYIGELSEHIVTKNPVVDNRYRQREHRQLIIDRGEEIRI